MEKPIVAASLFSRSFFVIITICLCITHSQQPLRPIFYQDESSVWIATPAGLIRYQPENQTASLQRPEPINDILFNDNTLWTATATGLWYADVRYLDWKKYSTANGLASDSIVRIAADLDFIYVAHPHACSRLDNLTGQWESFGDFSDLTVFDLYTDQDYLWVATEKGVRYFEKRFNVWKEYTKENGLLSPLVLHIFFFNESIWFLTDKGLSRYNPGMKAWNSYAFGSDIGLTSVKNLWTDAEYLWIAAAEGVYRFRSKNQTWEQFSSNSPLEKNTVRGAASVPQKAWFATENGIFCYQEDKRQWTTYTAIEGLSDDAMDNIICAGQQVIAYKGSSVQVYNSDEDLWKNCVLESNSSLKQQSSGKPQFFNDQRGLGVAMADRATMSLLGRAYMKIKNKADFPTPLFKSITDYIFNKNLDTVVNKDTIPRFKDVLSYWLKAQLNGVIDLQKDRSIRASYDNTDPLGERRYGVEYRGGEPDYLKKAGLHDKQKTDYFFSTLIHPTYIEGLAVRTEFGDRVGGRKLRRATTGLWAGRQKTLSLRKLIAFQEDNFYYLNVNNIITESVVLTVDGTVLDPRDYSL
ncbi:MAG: hypothetical protein JW795_20455, partial [Chitinivibrionales bacterium]|nr:hypothetical protein [Chitinivibrionales bacterium]